MSKRTIQSDRVAPQEATWSLWAPGMTPWHRAGVAGLYMTLRALESHKALPKGLLEWSSTDHSITLRWAGSAEEFFGNVTRAAYGVSSEGLIDPVAFPPSRDFSDRMAFHDGMRGVFLVNTAYISSGETKTVMVGERPMVQTYRSVVLETDEVREAQARKSSLLP